MNPQEKAAAAERFKELSYKYVNSAKIDEEMRLKKMIKNNLPTLNFVGRQNHYLGASCDVRITKVNRNKKKNPFYDETDISIKKELAEILSKTGYVMLARDYTRLYFKEASPEEGLKFTYAGSKSRTRIRMANRALDLKDFYGGDYKLEYDKDYGLYYVDVRRKDQK